MSYRCSRHSVLVRLGGGVRGEAVQESVEAPVELVGGCCLVGGVEGDGAEDVHVDQVGGVCRGVRVEAGVGQDGQQGGADGLGVGAVHGVVEQEVHRSRVREQFGPQVAGQGVDAVAPG